MTLFREVNIFQDAGFGYTNPLPLYRVVPPSPVDVSPLYTWKGKITALELTHNLKASNSLTFFLENSEGNPFLLVNEFRLLPSQGKVDLINVIFANRDFSFAEGTSLRVSLDKPERLREGDTISIIGSATEETLEDVVQSGDALTQEDLQNALQPYATSAEVSTALTQHEGGDDPHGAYTPTTALAALINSYIQAGDIAIPESEPEIKAKALFGYRSGQIVIDKSENIASITRAAVGRYQVTFTNPILHPYVVIGHSMFGDDSTNSHRVFDAVFRTDNGFLAMSSYEPTAFEDAEFIDFIVT